MKYHTEAYHALDADNLLIRLISYEAGQPLQPEQLAASLHPAELVIPLPEGPILCRNENCKTRSGTCTKGF
jgi:hypothetical protein